MKTYIALIQNAGNLELVTERVYAQDYAIAKNLLDLHLREAHRVMPTLFRVLSFTCITDGGYADKGTISRTLREYVREWQEANTAPLATRYRIGG